MKLSPVQRRILDVLADGYPHKKTELLECLTENGTVGALQKHITGIRNVLKRQGEGISTEFHNRYIYYRWVRYIHTSD